MTDTKSMKNYDDIKEITSPREILPDIDSILFSTTGFVCFGKTRVVKFSFMYHLYWLKEEAVFHSMKGDIIECIPQPIFTGFCRLTGGNVSQFLGVLEREKIGSVLEDLGGEKPVDEYDTYHYSVFEKLDKTLFKNSPKNDQELQQIMYDILHGLLYLEDTGVIHRDIKPANIMLQWSAQGALSGSAQGALSGSAQGALSGSAQGALSGSAQGALPRAKIIDFSHAHVLHTAHTDFSHEVVTTWYRAPEVFQKKRYDNSIDMFSLGLVLFEMITGYALAYIHEKTGTKKTGFKGLVMDEKKFVDFINNSYKKYTTEGDTQSFIHRDIYLEWIRAMTNNDPTLRPKVRELIANIERLQGENSKLLKPMIVMKKPVLFAVVKPSITLVKNGVSYLYKWGMTPKEVGFILPILEVIISVYPEQQRGYFFGCLFVIFQFMYLDKMHVLGDFLGSPEQMSIKLAVLCRDYGKYILGRGYEAILVVEDQEIVPKSLLPIEIEKDQESSLLID